jgi:putative transposase
MAEGHRMTAADLVDKLMASEHADVLRDSAAWLIEELMNAEVTALTGAELGERAPDRRQTQRNGYRQRRWDTRVGELELAIPKLRQGSYFPSFLEPRRRAEQALVAVVQEAYVNGVSTRKVDRLVEQLGLQGMTKDQVSRLCRGLDEQVTVFRERPLAGAYPYLWLDAKVERVREAGGVRHKALVIAYGVHETGRREVVGLDVGAAETESFWRAFLRSLGARGLDGVQLVISDAHTGLKTAIGKVFGCPWQRCTVHFLRDMLGHVTRTQQPLVSGAIRQIFTAASAAEARERLAQVADQLRVLAWRKRIWRCAEPACGVRTWTEQTEVIRPRVVLTERARAEACRRVGKDAHAVAAVARDLGVGWATIMRRWLTTAARWWMTRRAWTVSPRSAWMRPAS